jgi:hypothetical protein
MLLATRFLSYSCALISDRFGRLASCPRQGTLCNRFLSETNRIVSPICPVASPGVYRYRARWLPLAAS